ncbi:DUF4389 domain-containing protein [Sinisalibacter aestuarii]|uniref:DUF4389 domain-containing protein n=1 Tax=Sinisalibacter aestuarii TaxID=2949426 RepID=A0ABQ5LWG0_9RHOB|nr:DUF4389 domain-containing protein [Sinisalibacter aestuarii]GKY88701.1 hypothetical protein STA1M1_25700 [Sinisalibacter aestuarii]
MAKKTTKKPAEEDVEPTVLEEPGVEDAPEIDWDDDDNNVWLRGLYMLILGVLFELGRAILWIAAVLQFLWLLFAKEKNRPIADFGKDLSDWLARITLFQTGATEDKPFPFERWGKAD